MARRNAPLGRVLDVWGAPWDVHERRPTVHGWMVGVGYPAPAHERQGAAVILTHSLAEYLIATRPRDVVLPLGSTVIKRLRRELGLRWDWDIWWAERSGDLATMTLDAFCARHGCSIGAASQRRSSLKRHF